MAVIPKIEQYINDLVHLDQGSEKYKEKLYQVWEEAKKLDYIDSSYDSVLSAAKTLVIDIGWKPRQEKEVVEAPSPKTPKKKKTKRVTKKKK